MSGLALPRLVIAAPHGRSGKTTVSLALVGALAAQGLVVQPFKKGPDYIDPSWLSAAAGRPARNLDPFMLDSLALLHSLVGGSGGAQVAVIEGNHGLYDALDDSGAGSTAALARQFSAPILLVIDAARLGRSAAALVQGFQRFEPGTHIAGVILTNVAQPRHEARLRSAIEQHCTIPVLGALPRDAGFAIADRHLGLIPSSEHSASPLQALAQAGRERFDLPLILSIARAAPPLPAPDQAPQPAMAATCRIGVLRDRAFTFYYPENLEALALAGAELVNIDALAERSLPQVDALYIGGGFPEVFGAELEANSGLRTDIGAAIEDGLPVYAECGGLMYLARSLTWQGQTHRMVGALPCDIELAEKPQGHGYVAAAVVADNPYFAVGAVLRGHEYHHSRPVNLSLTAPDRLAYTLRRGRGLGPGVDGIVHKNVLAVYTHLHALGAPAWAPALVRRATERAHEVSS